MYVWRLWGDVWVVDRDPLTFIIGNLLLLVFMVTLTVVFFALWIPFMAIKWGWDRITTPALMPVSGSTASALVHAGAQAPAAIAPNGDNGTHVTTIGAHGVADECPHCGNTTSLDIRPCIRCGN